MIGLQREMREATRHAVHRQCTALLCAGLALGACSGDDRPAAAAPASVPVQTSAPGIDVLLRDSLHVLQGRRVGLITNHTGLTAAGQSTIDALAAAPGIELVALFAPEHGIRGTAEAGARIDSSRDSITGLPIHSLYGETRIPTAAMLSNVDALVFDIQDIGTRYYTYVWTMALAMRAAAAQGKRFVVLDRPNPIGGTLVQGNVLDTAFASFVGLLPVTMRHGMTAGELARWINGESGTGADLVVIPVADWSRPQWYDETGLTWVAPSPNMPSLESAAHYPGSCLFEGTNLSVGRGTDLAFQQIGAPWLEAGRIVQRIHESGVSGVRIDTVRFTPRSPGDGKHDGVEVRGLRFTVIDRATYDPVLTAVATLHAIHAEQPDSLTFREAHFDRLAGTDRLRRAILDGDGVADIIGPWSVARTSFMAARARYLIYGTADSGSTEGDGS